MIFVNMLRMVVDLSIYFFFAELIAVSFGGKSMLIEMLLLCLCYGILISLQKHTKNRIFLLLPFLLLFIPEAAGMTLANRIALFPPMIYVIYLIIKEEYGLSHDRQIDMFSISWKVFLIAGIFLCITGQYKQVLSYSAPIAFISLFVSVLLLRMLRHEPEVYLSREYQMKNLLLLGGVMIIAWFSSRDIVWKTIGNACGFLYMHFLVPIFTFFISCTVVVIELFMKLFSWLKLGEIELQEHEMMQSEEVNPFSDLEENLTSGNHSIESILIGIAVIALIIAVFLLFRWLAANNVTEHMKSHEIDIVRNTETNVKKKGYSSSTAHQIRKQYRKFLKLYGAHGAQVLPSDTSEDITQKAGQIFSSPELLDEMRAIYIQARYHNQASRTDLKKMKQITQMLKEKASN